jgi:hypothetical protein
MSEDVPGSRSVASLTDARQYFRDELQSALGRRRVAVKAETEAYLVNLLVEFLSADQLFLREADGTVQREPLAFMLKKAVEAPAGERQRHLKRMGDTALYVSGFFSDSLQRSLVDVDYYAAMGGRAYDALSGLSPRPPAAPVFGELAAKFQRVVDIFSDLSERAAITSNTGLLRLYERYVRTGSERLRELLATRGVLVLAAPTDVQ